MITEKAVGDQNVIDLDTIGNRVTEYKRRVVVSDIQIDRKDGQSVTDDNILEIEQMLNSFLTKDYRIRFHIRDDE